MYCGTCNLHYPDHLSFCRRCGKPLVRNVEESVVDSFCCTRCGARVVRGENFCQQCGNKLNVKEPETVVGACDHCGVSWRSGWLFCRGCGLDRDHALMKHLSAPVIGSTVSPFAQTIEDLPRVDRVHCRFCGSESKPYSRFCDTCGHKLPFEDEEDIYRTESEYLPIENYHEVADSEIYEAEVIDESVDPAIRSRVSGKLKTDLERERRTVAIPSDAIEQNIRPGYSATGDGGVRQTRSRIRTTVEPVTSRDETAGAVGKKPRLIDQSNFHILVTVAGILLMLIAVYIYWTNNREPAGSTQNVTADQSPAPAVSPIPDEPGPSSTISQPAKPTVPPGMIYIPGGTFIMGRDDGDQYERPARRATVGPFYIDRAEVTNGQYKVFVDATGRKPPSSWPGGRLDPAISSYPVVSITWNDAVEYARWAGKRLPTEEEWEFAARGLDGRLYPWGNQWDPKYSNAGRTRGGKISEAGSFQLGASPFGVVDMSGNVWEWTSTTFSRAGDNAASEGQLKIVRGGAHDAPPEWSTVTYRGFLFAGKAYPKTGFRCVRDIK